MITNNRRVVVAGIIGNIVEYYDFALIGFMAVIMGELFFPSDNHFLSLLGSFGAFAAGMIMRPIGAGIFGHIGDKIGRRFALMASLVMMALPTLLIGFLPTYATIGIAAPILLVLLRMVQGLSVGGEYASSIVYLVEQAPSEHKNLYGSFVSVGAKIGMALGAGFSGALFWYLGDEVMQEWGWRVPFIFSVVIAGAGVYLRKNLTDNYEVKESKAVPIVEIFKHHKKLFFRLVFIASTIWAFYYTLFIYLPIWLEKYASFSKQEAGNINIFSITIGAVLIPLMGMLADKVGSWKVIRFTALIVSLAIMPLFLLLQNSSFYGALAIVGVITALLCAYQAPIFAAVVYALGEHGYRASFTALILGSAAGVVGGATPAFMTLLSELSHNPTMPAFVLAFFSFASFVILGRIKANAK